MDLLEEASYQTPFALSPLFPLLIVSLTAQRNGPKTKNTFQAEYDFIVVGAGSAGSVVASRLSEVPCVSVLLLEAGKSPPHVIDVPAVCGSFVSSDLNWNFKTVPQKHTGASVINRELPCPTGKTLGGSSSINSMLSSRGNRRNYDDWANSGATGWSYKEVLPYFIKLEDNKNIDSLANGYHGVGGPVTISRPAYQSEIKGPISDAALDLGYKFVDNSGPTQTGFHDFQATIRNGQRCSAAKAYLVPAENRANLDILAQAFVTKILIEDKVAVGVEFDFQGSRHQVKARKEVIVSAGAYNSPKLLMLSGIGPKRDLQNLKIPVVEDLPVGKNLQNHGLSFVAFEMDQSIPELNKKISDPQNIMDYIINRKGPLVDPFGLSLIADLTTNATKEAQDIPEFQLHFLEISTYFGKIGVPFKPEVYNQLFGPYEGKPILACTSHVLSTSSRGCVRLKSRNPYDSPEIDPNYFDEEKDVNVTIEGLKTCITIMSHPALSKLGVKPFTTVIPECESSVADLDDLLRCNIGAAIMSMSHHAGTVKMGDIMDPTTVLDPQLRVKGMKKLRVVDASIMPTIIWGHTNIPTMMIAEKASDMIKSSISCHSD